MRSLFIVYGLVVAALVLAYLLVIWLLMRSTRRKEERRMQEAQDALATGHLHKAQARAVDRGSVPTSPLSNENPRATEQP